VTGAWKGDPALKALRDEFIESFEERLEALTAVRSLEDLREIAHKAAGIAGSYGFGTVSRIAGMIDDLLGFRLSPAIQDRLTTFSGLLRDSFSVSLEHKEDPIDLERDPRFRELTSCVESLLSEAKNESS
jgi:hypothetical protein